MATMECEYIGNLNTYFTLPGSYPLFNSQIFFGTYIYGFTSSIIFKYPTDLTPTGASYVSIANVAAITIDQVLVDYIIYY